MKISINEIDLGDIEFAPDRKDIYYLEREEPNTPEEDELWNCIISWVNDIKQPSKQAFDNLVGAMRHPKYKKFFNEPAGSVTVYRGLSVHEEKLAKWLGIGVEELRKKPRGFADGDWTFKPRDPNERFVSYTRNERTAYIFSALNPIQNGGYRIVVEAHISLNPEIFFDLNGVLNRIDNENGIFSIDIEKEAEVIATGPVKVSRIWWKSEAFFRLGA